MLIMEETIRKASKLVAFHSQLAQRCQERWKLPNTKIVLIPPAVTCGTSYSIITLLDASSSSYSLYDALQLPTNSPLFLLPCSIRYVQEIFSSSSPSRPVKDPAFLIKDFSQLHQTSSSKPYLIIVGPTIDSDYANHFHSVASQHPGVFYLRELSQMDLHHAMSQCFAVVNSSISEGLANVLLEALYLSTACHNTYHVSCIGVPVIARRNVGNCVIIQDYETGLIFDTPQQFVEKATLLLKDPPLRTKLITQGRSLLNSQYSLEQERRLYQSLVLEQPESAASDSTHL